jgi:hypothetical protein
VAKANTQKPAKPKKLSPAAARRHIEALEKFLADGDITLKQFWSLKSDALAAMGAGHD